MAKLRALAVVVVLLGVGIPGSRAQSVQTGHCAPGWNGNLKAGVMAPGPGLYMQGTAMFFNAHKFLDGSGNTVSGNETDYVLGALAFVWRPDFKLLGANYQVVATPALGNLSGRPVLVDGRPQDAPVGFTDMFFSPLGLGWHWSELRLVAAFGTFAPTGKFEALLPHDAEVLIENLDPDKRPLSATADFQELFEVASVSVREDPSYTAKILFDRDHSLKERVLREQFVE